MKKAFNRIKLWVGKGWFKTKRMLIWLFSLPDGLKLFLGILLILIGIVNIPNPIINGIFLALIGLRMVSDKAYRRIKLKLRRRKMDKIALDKENKTTVV